MNALLNYCVEANLGLCLMLLMYVMFLGRETDFSVKRFFLLASICASLLFPLIQIEITRSYVPSLTQVIPPIWLPEVIVTAEGSAKSGQWIDFWFIVRLVYGLGVGIGLLQFLLRLLMIGRILMPLRSYKFEENTVFESAENRSSFSFFNFIYIGQADKLSLDEKAMILHHEQMHAGRLHSFDILLINSIGIFFWFNPVISLYKKIFIQLHEFEADARSVSTRDVNNYCSLLAKVALMSADIKLANHFSNSLTIKRIEMMRTVKSKIKRWKYVAMSAVLPCFFFVVACQEQVASELTEVARNAHNTTLAPAHVQARYDELKKANPGSRLLLLDLNNEALSTLQNLENTYGRPKSLEIFNKNEEQPKKVNYLNTVVTTANAVQFVPDGAMPVADEKHTYAILEYDKSVGAIAENAKSSDAVYPVVDEPAEYPGGLEALVQFLQSHLKYPMVAREQGIEGTVFVVFLVEKDGTITSVEPIKSLSPETDAEAVRVIESFPKWKPGKKDGNIVRSSFIIPIKYNMAAGAAQEGN